jgi:hypothetical protein
MSNSFFKDIFDISSVLINTYRSQLDFNGISFDPNKIRNLNSKSLEKFNFKYPEITTSGHVTDFQAYIQFKDGIQQRCLLVEGFKFNKTLQRIKNNTRYTEVKGERITKDSAERTIHNLFDNYWTYAHYLTDYKYTAVLNIILAEIWFKKNIPEVFNSNNFNFESSKHKNLLKMDFEKELSNIESRYQTFSNFQKLDRELILLEFSNIFYSNNYYLSLIKELPFTKITDKHRDFINSADNDGYIFDFWNRVFHSNFKPYYFYFHQDPPNIKKIIA